MTERKIINMETQVIEKTENTVTKRKMSVKKRIIILIFAVILPLAILLTAFSSRNLIQTVASVKKISDAPAYQMITTAALSLTNTYSTGRPTLMSTAHI